LVEHYQPDLLILDLMMPGLNGLQVLKQIKTLSPKTRVLVYSNHGDPAYVHQALEYGATGYLLKDSSTTELVEAVRKVAAGQLFLNSTISKNDIDLYAKKKKNTHIDSGGQGGQAGI